MNRLAKRGLDRRGWLYVSSGIMGALLITAAAAWATPNSNTATVVVTPNSTTATGSVGVNIRSYTTVLGNAAAGLPRLDNANILINYQFRIRPIGETSGGGVCEHQPTNDVGAFAENGTIGSAANPLTRLVKWNPIFDQVDTTDPNDPHSHVCWSTNPAGQPPGTSSPPTNFYLL